MKVTIVGAGNLGVALARSLLASAVVTPSDLSLRRRSSSDGIEGLAQLGCKVHGPRSPADPGDDSEVVIIAVKPQSAQEVCQAWSTGINPQALVISVMAGVPIQLLSSWLGGHLAVVRAMPNLGAHVQQSATAFLCHEELPLPFVFVTRRIVESFGVALQVYTEELVDAATAIAGSGPAYFYWCAEQMVKAGVELGFSETESQDLVTQTLRGTADYLCASRERPSVLRERVTSKRGTTSAALTVLSDAGAADIFASAIRAAFERAQELSKNV
jgi:pyrroline-5-carboxylate reductase